MNSVNEGNSGELNYPGFNYPANQLSKFIAAADLFTILLKNGEIIHYTAVDKTDFHQWLAAHDVKNIKFG